MGSALKDFTICDRDRHRQVQNNMICAWVGEGTGVEGSQDGQLAQPGKSKKVLQR